MPVTTPTLLYAGLLKDMRTVCRAADLDDDRVYMAIEPFPDDRFESCVQLIPSTGAAQHPTAGHGLIEEEFQIVVWRRLELDAAKEATARLIDDALGLLSLVDRIRSGPNGNDGMIQSMADGQATIPVRWLRSDKPSQPPAGTIFSQRADTYIVGAAMHWGNTT